MTVANHVPVLINTILEACTPVEGRWLDGTFGAGGYTRALLNAGAAHVTAVDRDPFAFEMASAWVDGYTGRLTMQLGLFSSLDQYSTDLNGVVLDLGVSSMQLDQAQRGFSFMQDGPLDMRMGQKGPSAADIVNAAEESVLADILFLYGEERASRRIARAIVAARPVNTTMELADIIVRCLPRAKPGQSHPATRSFQALRIAVNNEYQELYQGLMAAERALRPGGVLAVATFHSIEDRMVKRFLTARAGQQGNVNRYAPETARTTAAFVRKTRKAVVPSHAEIATNPRARSAKLRLAFRTDAPSHAIQPEVIGMPQIQGRLC